MKKVIVVTLLLLFVVAIGVLAYLRLRPNEEKRINKQLNSLAERVSKKPGESNSVMALKMHGLSDLFEPEVSLEIEDFPFNGVFLQNEIASHVARGRSSFRTMSLSFHDIKITLEAPDSATVELTGRLILKLSENKERNEDTREIICRMKKTDKTWRFAGFEEVRVLER